MAVIPPGKLARRGGRDGAAQDEFSALRRLGFASGLEAKDEILGAAYAYVALIG